MTRPKLQTYTLVLAVLLALLCVHANASAQHLRREDGESRIQSQIVNYQPVSSPIDGEQRTLLTQTPISCPTSTQYYLNFYNQSYTDAQVQEIILNFVFDCQMQLEQLTSFTVDLRYNQLTTVKSVSYVLRPMKNLTSLTIYLEFNRINNTGLADVQKMFQYNPLLQYLYLDLSYNQLTDVYPFKFAFKSLSQLTTLYLYFYNNYITDVAFASTAFYNLTKLQYLSVQMQGNQVNSLSPLAYAFDKCVKLQELYIDASSNRVNSTDFVRTAFQKLFSLYQIYLNLKYNQIVDVSPFETAFRNNNALRSLYLYIYSNKISQGIDQFIDGIQLDVGDRKAFCPLYLDMTPNPLTDTQRQRLGILKQNLQDIYNTVTCSNKGFTFYY